MIRDHGPDDSTLKLCLYTVNAFMGEDGSAYPSQASIAKAAGLSEKTAQRVLAIAIDTGWLCVTTRAAKGKAWKSYTYRPAIPDVLTHCETMQQPKVAKDVLRFHLKYGPLYKGGRPYKDNLPKVPPEKALGPLSEGARSPFKRNMVPSQDGTKDLSEGSYEGSKKGDPERCAVSIETLTPEQKAKIADFLQERPDIGNPEIAIRLGLPTQAVYRYRTTLLSSRLTLSEPKRFAS